MLKSKFSPDQTTLIYRNDTTQLEIVPELRDTVLQKIRWKSECEYELKFVKRNHIKNDSLTKFLDPQILHVTILNAKKDYYIFRMYIEGIDFSVVDTLRKIN